MKHNECILLLISVAAVIVAEKDKNSDVEAKTDLVASPTSAKLFNLGGLFGQNSNYPYGYGSYVPNTYNRPSYSNSYPSAYYPSSGWSGSNYYPGQGNYGNNGNYYPNYPTTSSYYPSNGYYPAGGTNILGGNGGYGGYGGNGGLRQYSGYLNPGYIGHRNRGYGYSIDTDRNGLPRKWSGSKDYSSYGSENDRVSGSYRGYN